MKKTVISRSPASRNLIKVLQDLNLVCETCVFWQENTQCWEPRGRKTMYGLCSNLGFTATKGKLRGGVPKVVFDTPSDEFQGPQTHREFGCNLYSPQEI